MAFRWLVLTASLVEMSRTGTTHGNRELVLLTTSAEAERRWSAVALECSLNVCRVTTYTTLHRILPSPSSPPLTTFTFRTPPSALLRGRCRVRVTPYSLQPLLTSTSTTRLPEQRNSAWEFNVKSPSQSSR